jgi:cell division protein FtsB
VNQQEKIEEIYLHLIELNKEMKALKAENEELSVQVERLKEEIAKRQ